VINKAQGWRIVLFDSGDCSECLHGQEMPKQFDRKRLRVIQPPFTWLNPIPSLCLNEPNEEIQQCRVVGAVRHGDC
jgi:hypothetical protein